VLIWFRIVRSKCTCFWVLAMYDSKHKTTDTQIYDTRKDGSGYSSTKREWNLQTHGFNDETSNHRKYMRTQSSADNRIVSSSSQRQNGEKKTVKDSKKPLRVSGDWSEFKSSTGKTYFYNCKTEISQWEKPKGWSSNESNRTSTSSISSTDRIKKESTTTNISPTIRTRYKMEESSSHQKFSQILNNHQNGHHKFQESFNEQLPITSHNRLPSPADDSSRMSFSSTSSKESSSIPTAVNNGNESNDVVLQSSLSEPVSTPISDNPSKTLENNPIPINGNDTKNSMNRSIMSTLINTESTQAIESEPITPSISKAEREQEIQKFYRAELIQHLTDWPSTQLEKQCLKLFDDYYGYNAKMSTAFTELKALKSNFRILEIKRNILTQKLLHTKERKEDKHS